MRHALGLLFGALAWIGGGMSPSAAGNLTVAPTRIDLQGERLAGAITLQNNASLPVTVQVQTFAWDDSPEMASLKPTRDLLAVPPVLEIPPGEKRPIRVALRERPAGTKEETYRLVVTEVSRPLPGGGVQFALRLSLPVFATPSGAQPRPSWALQKNGKSAELHVVNEGTAHIQVTRIRLLDAEGKQLQEIGKPAYVLAGQQQSWPVDLPGKALGALTSLAAETSAGEILAPLSARGG